MLGSIMALVSCETRKLLANRPFLCLWINQMLTSTAFYLVSFAMVIWVFKLMRMNIAVSLWLLTALIPSATLSIVSGVVADTHDRKKIMLTTNLLWALAVLLYIVARSSFPAVLVVTAVAQGIDEFFLPAQTATIPRLVPKSALLAANSLLSLSAYAATVAGFVLAGPLLRFFGFEAPLIVAAALSLLGMVFISRLPAVVVRGSAEPLVSQLGHGITSGISFFLQQPRVRAAALFMAVLTAGGMVAGTLAPGFMEQSLGIDAEDISLVGGVPLCLGLILGTVLLRKVSRRKGWGSERMVGTGFIMLGVATLGLALVPVFRPCFVSYATRLANHLASPRAFEFLPGVSLVVGGLVFALGVAMTFVAIPVATFLQKVTPDKIRGRVYGFLDTVNAVLQSSVTLFFGAGADVLTPVPLIAAVGILALAAGLFRNQVFGWLLARLEASPS